MTRSSSVPSSASMKSSVLVLVLLCLSAGVGDGFSMTMQAQPRPTLSRRDVMGSSVAAICTAAATIHAGPAVAAPVINNLENGIKYAVTREPPKAELLSNTGTYPQTGDIVAVEFTGYLTNGQIFDATHSEGKANALLFKLGSGNVIPGLDSMVLNMQVGQKVQAIMPPAMAYADKGVCLEDGECLIKPGSTLVYDIFLKKSSIPPP